MTHLPHTLCAVLVAALMGGCAGSDSDRDETLAAEQGRRARAAVAICQEAYGPTALILWTHEGHLVCRRESNPATVAMKGER